MYCADSHLTPLSLCGRVLTHFGLVAPLTSGRAREQFQALLADLATAQGKHPLLLIDEGHELSPEMVQELRYLQNVQDCDAASPFTLILCGQPELRAMLSFKTFEAVAQRISVRCHLPPLRPRETAAFWSTASNRQVATAPCSPRRPSSCCTSTAAASAAVSATSPRTPCWMPPTTRPRWSKKPASVAP